MKTLALSIFALCLFAAVVAMAAPGNTAAAVLALGTPFALFANVMAEEGDDGRGAKDD